MQPKISPLELLYSSSEESTDESDTVVSQVRVADKGSQAHCARVLIQGVPAYGVIDSGTDITIMGGTLFKRVATAARLKETFWLLTKHLAHTTNVRLR